MKSESSKKMMLRHIILLGCFVSFTLGQTQSAYSLSKIPKKSELKHSKLGATLDLKKQQFYSSKERPELNPVLSALINEDIKKSIDAKRHAEEFDKPTTSTTSTTTAVPILTTTTRKSIPKSVNDGLLGDDSLDEAGSENKQTSRIQVKKGPNGVDYEYEYVYYYYDDDEKEAKKATVPTTERIEKDVVRPTGKNRYASVDRASGSGASANNAGSSTTKPIAAANEIPSSRGKGRQIIPVVEEVVEERLPAITRFPPRNPVASVIGAATPSVSVVSTIDETTKKISVKRPSLELVDSHSFSRGDKTLSKGSRNNDNNEFGKSSSDKLVIPLSVAALDANESTVGASSSTSTSTSIAPPTAPSNEQQPTTLADEWSELTTQIMDRVALDLYAHLVNENSISDATTVPDDDDDIGAGISGGAGITTDSTGPTATPDNDDYTTYIAPVSSIKTTTTTTEAATTTTTTTTTTELPLVHGRKSPFGGRNRFRLRPIATTPATETAERKDVATESSALKPKNRFSRPSFGRTRPAAPTAAVSSTDSGAAAVEETAVKDEKPAVAASPIRTRTRNRYNLRTSASPDKSADENADNASIGGSSTTQRISAGVRPRVPFNLRGRSRPTPAAPTSSDSESSASSSSSLPDDAHTAEAQEPKVEVEKPGHSTVAALKPSSRFNLRRPNQLLSARGRVSPLLKTSATTESTKTSDGTNSPDNEKEVTAVTVPDNNSSGNGNNNNKESSDEGDQGNAEASTQPQTGLSRLRNRPRIQIKPRTPNADAKAAPTPLSAANRKVNPLISRRKLGGSTSTTTTEETIAQEDTTLKDYGQDDGADDEQTEAVVVEVTSEQPRSLGILGRRRLPIRKPGTILHNNQN